MPIVLNWLEIEKAVQLANSELAGQHVEQWIVPERSRFAQGFLKGEWLIRTGGRKAEGVFLFSVRPRHPYFAYRTGKGPKATQVGTRSPFDLAVSKQVKGRRIHSLVALKRERMIVLWFETGEREKLGLLISLIPSTPEAILVEGDPAAATWKILARSRANTQQQESEYGSFTPPDGFKAPANPALREELVRTPESLWNAIEADLDKEAFEARITNIRRELKTLAAKASDRAEQSDEAAKRGGAEPDWQRYGDLLKSVLHDAPACDAEGNRWVTDFYDENGASRAIPCDPRLSAAEQVAKFYSLAKRKSRRIAEGLSRKAQFTEVLSRFERELASLPEYPNWPEVERLERIAGIERVSAPPAGQKRTGQKSAAWLGRTFRSREGLPIYIGKTSAENLELTFKVARGNDIWMHVRGRPGAHVLIPLSQGKSAPLETLLDGAVLAVYFSGGESWGKTEVDYTFKKHVRRIKDSTEASYTHNKTLLVEPEAARLKRLLETNER